MATLRSVIKQFKSGMDAELKMREDFQLDQSKIDLIKNELECGVDIDDIIIMLDKKSLYKKYPNVNRGIINAIVDEIEYLNLSKNFIPYLANPEYNEEDIDSLFCSIEVNKVTVNDFKRLYEKGLGVNPKLIYRIILWHGIIDRKIVDKYSKPEMNGETLEWVLLAHKKGLDPEKIDKYLNMGFNAEQLEQIYFGMYQGLSDDEIDTYAILSYNERDMENRRLDLVKHEDPYFYKDDFYDL